MTAREMAIAAPNFEFQLHTGGLHVSTQLPAQVYLKHRHETGSPWLERLVGNLTRQMRRTMWTDPTTFFGIATSSPDFLAFIKCSRIRVSREYYFQNRRGHLANNTLEGHQLITYVGKTSYNWKVVIADDKRQALVDEDNYLVLVDKKKHRPAAIPTSFKSRFQDPVVEEKPEIFRPQTVPENSYFLRVVVGEDDIDFNGHTTGPSYVSLCAKCASEAAQTNFFQSDKLTVKNMDAVKDFYILYLGESKLGDTLTVNSWADPTAKDRIHFMIHNQTKPVMYANLQVYTDIAFSSKL